MMRRPALVPMAWRLRARGFQPLLFAYSTLWREPEEAIQSLAARLRALGGPPVHLLGHSLGGVIALETLRRFPDLPVARVLCLGSPIAGSGAARGLAGKGLGFVSGRSGPLLQAGLPALPGGHDIGMIAGSRPMGLGRLFGQFQDEHDGTVAVAETRLPGLAAHTILHASHSGLIVSGQAAELSARFLARGRFDAT
jgi:pimeloyl-ACP methyl ester carboxylesterase